MDPFWQSERYRRYSIEQALAVLHEIPLKEAREYKQHLEQSFTVAK
jgi:hypothetical protein